MGIIIRTLSAGQGGSPGVLFGSKFCESLVFKGGTSLSKVFQVIERFSEDIDLSISPALLGLPDTVTGTIAERAGGSSRG